MYQQPRKQSEIEAIYQQQMMLRQGAAQISACDRLNAYGQGMNLPTPDLLQNAYRQGLVMPRLPEQDSEEVAWFKRWKAAQQRQIDVRRKMWKLMNRLSTAE